MRRLLAKLAKAMAGRGDYSELGLRQRIDLVSVMITVAIAGVVGYVSINIMSDTSQNSGLGDYTTDTANNTQWQNTSLELHNGLEGFYSQLGTIFTVIALVVIIAYLMLLRRGR